MMHGIKKSVMRGKNSEILFNNLKSTVDVANQESIDNLKSAQKTLAKSTDRDGGSGDDENGEGGDNENKVISKNKVTEDDEDDEAGEAKIMPGEAEGLIDGVPDISQFPPTNFVIDVSNPFDWCDMSDPFMNPFCPTPNPMFNILIKMMIPGAIRPVIDQVETKFMAGQNFPLALLAVLIPPMDGGGAAGGPAFLEEREDLESQGEGHNFKVVPALKQGLYKQLVHPMTMAFTPLLVNSLSMHITDNIANSINNEMKEVVNTTIAHGLEHILINALGVALTHTVGRVTNVMLPQYVADRLRKSLLPSLTRVLTHTLAPSIVMSTMQKSICSANNYQGSTCQQVLELTSYFASYYSDYYSIYALHS
jgi:hypothetical protein